MRRPRTFDLRTDPEAVLRIDPSDRLLIARFNGGGGLLQLLARRGVTFEQAGQDVVGAGWDLDEDLGDGGIEAMAQYLIRSNGGSRWAAISVTRRLRRLRSLRKDKPRAADLLAAALSPAAPPLERRSRRSLEDLRSVCQSGRPAVSLMDWVESGVRSLVISPAGDVTKPSADVLSETWFFLVVHAIGDLQDRRFRRLWLGVDAPGDVKFLLLEDVPALAAARRGGAREPFAPSLRETGSALAMGAGIALLIALFTAGLQITPYRAYITALAVGVSQLIGRAIFFPVVSWRGAVRHLLIAILVGFTVLTVGAELAQLMINAAPALPSHG